jgi:hypothetical protein
MAVLPTDVESRKKTLIDVTQLILGCGASKLNTETGSPARSTQDAPPTIIVEKLTVKLDAQQLISKVPRSKNPQRSPSKSV